MIAVSSANNDCHDKFQSACRLSQLIPALSYINPSPFLHHLSSSPPESTPNLMFNANFEHSQRGRLWARPRYTGVAEETRCTVTYDKMYTCTLLYCTILCHTILHWAEHTHTCTRRCPGVQVEGELHVCVCSAQCSIITWHSIVQ